jgi:hypothetical protein
MLREKLKLSIIVAHRVLEFRNSSSLIRKIYFSYSMDVPSYKRGMSMFEKFVSSCVNFLFPKLVYSTMIPKTPSTQPAIIKDIITQNPVYKSVFSLSRSSVGSKYSISALEIFRADYSPM